MKVHWALLLALLMLQGCYDATHLHYETFTQDLDGKNELEISTYPSDFPDKLDHVPFLYKRVQTPELVYFQFFVRAKGKNGKNPHIEDIMVHSFSVNFPGQEPVVFIEEYPDNFWMQGDPRYGNAEISPIRHSEGWYLQANVDLTVNGQRYQISERIHAGEDRYFMPLLVEALR